MKIKPILSQLNKLFPLVCAIICLIHFLFWLYICYPGVLYGDNMMMLAEALPGGGIGDQHSVMFIWFIRINTKLFGYSLGYPLIWGLFFWYLGVYLFTTGLFNLLRNYLVLIFIAIFSYLPYINFILPHLQLKDFSMSALLFAACGMLFWVSTLRHEFWKKWLLVPVLLLFFIAVNFRHNAIFAFIPFAFFLTSIFFADNSTGGYFSKKKRVFRIVFFSLVLIIAEFAGKSIFENKVEDYKNYFVHTSIFTFDLAGISVNMDKMEIPEEWLMNQTITIDTLKKVFNTVGWDPLWGGLGNPTRIVKGGETAEDVELWRAKWFFTVLDNPGTYLKHRSDHFGRFISSKNEYLCICEWPPDVGKGVLKSLLPEPMQGHLDNFPVESFKIRGIDFLRDMQTRNKLLEKGTHKEFKYGEWLFMTYPRYTLRLLNYAVFISAIFWLFTWLRPRYFSSYQRKIIPLASTVFLSGYFYFLFYFFVSISSDWRYIHWSGLSFWIGSSLMVIALMGCKPYFFLYMKVKKLTLKGLRAAATHFKLKRFSNRRTSSLEG